MEGLRALTSRARHLLDAIKFEHTVFALPFAYIAMVLASGGWPGWRTVGWVTAAMIGARTCAMATNRVVDRWIDAANPRTAGRHLPRGLLQVGELRAFALGGAALMLVAAWRLNPLCLALAPLALVFLIGYNYIWLVTGDRGIAPSLLALMGISAVTAIAAEAIPTRGRTNTASAGFWQDLVTDERGTVALDRFQIVAWTVVLGGVFFFSVLWDLTMPEYSPTMLALMGISSGTYLGFKLPTKAEGSST